MKRRDDCTARLGCQDKRPQDTCADLFCYGLPWLVEEGGQAVVTTMAQHVEVPPRRYP